MKRLLLLSPLLLGLAGCGHNERKEPAVTQKALQTAREQARLDQAEKNKLEAQTGVTSVNRVTPAPEAEYHKAKVLEADPRGCTWIESRGLVTVGEDETKGQVRASAVNAARNNAMQDFLGVGVKSRNMDFQQEGLKDQQQIVESMLLTTRQGRILDENVESEGYRDSPGCPSCRYAVTLKSCIQPRAADADKDFMIDLGLSRNKLVEGDEVKLNVTATKDCYVYVYDLWQDWEKAAMIVPNDIVQEVHLKAGDTWEYPDDKAKAGGVVALQASLPEGYKVSAETIRVIASKTPLPKRTTDPSQGFLAVLRRMNAARIDWAEDAQAFTIYKR